MAQRLPPLVIGGLAVWFIVQAKAFNAASGSVPILIGWSVLALAALELASSAGGVPARALNRLFSTATTPPHPAAPDPVAPVSRRRQAVAIVGVATLVAAFLLAGILPASAAFVMLAIRFGAAVSWRMSVLSGALMAALVWLIFAALLGLDLPGGIIFDENT